MIFNRSLTIDSWAELEPLPFPFSSLVADEAACMRVFTLEKDQPTQTKENNERTCLADRRHLKDKVRDIEE